MLRRATITAASCIVVVAACFPEFEFEDDGGSGAQMGGSAGTTTTGGDGGSGSGCAVADLGVVGVCGEGNKCTVVDIGDGDVGCGPAGSTTRWQLCVSDADCVDGTWCDIPYGVCKPFCDNEDDCELDGFSGRCAPLLDSMGMPLPGLAKHCTSNCDPRTAEPCDLLGRLDPLNCIYVDSVRGFDCATSDNIAEGFPCEDSTECGATMVCLTVDPNPGRCLFWCDPINDFADECLNPGRPVCYGTTPMVSWNGTPMGGCGEL